jgi:hypothetical protein
MQRLGCAWEYSQEVPGWRNKESAPGGWAEALQAASSTHPLQSHPCLLWWGGQGWRNTASPCSSREMLAGCLPWGSQAPWGVAGLLTEPT